MEKSVVILDQDSMKVTFAVIAPCGPEQITWKGPTVLEDKTY